MPEPELFLLFLEPLNRVGLRYMVTGSLAAIAYGEPRLTLDVDIVLELADHELARLTEAFREPAFYCPPLEVLRVEQRRPQRGHFNLIHLDSGLKADVYLAGRDPFHAWAMARRRAIVVNDLKAWFAPPEYVILRKLQFYQEGQSEKHLQDIQGILRCSSQMLDMAWLNHTLRDQGLEPLWTQCQSSLP